MMGRMDAGGASPSAVPGSGLADPGRGREGEGLR